MTGPSLIFDELEDNTWLSNTGISNNNEFEEVVIGVHELYKDGFIISDE